jgi:hypothetical protein
MGMVDVASNGLSIYYLTRTEIKAFFGKAPLPESKSFSTLPSIIDTVPAADPNGDVQEEYSMLHFTESFSEAELASLQFLVRNSSIWLVSPLPVYGLEGIGSGLHEPSYIGGFCCCL